MVDGVRSSVVARVVGHGHLPRCPSNASLERSPRAADDLPVEIARRRYAAGEITKEEFDQLRDDLQRRPA